MALSERTKSILRALEEEMAKMGRGGGPTLEEGGPDPKRFLDEIAKRRPDSYTLKDCLANREEAEHFIACLWGLNG